jgi:hypothetical protein
MKCQHGEEKLLAVHAPQARGFEVVLRNTHTRSIQPTFALRAAMKFLLFVLAFFAVAVACIAAMPYAPPCSSAHVPSVSNP